MKTHKRIIAGTIAALATFSLLLPTAATAAPQTSSLTATSPLSLENGSTNELAATLESVFTDAIILSDSGVVSVDRDKLRSILGDAEASKVIDQLLVAEQGVAWEGTLGIAQPAASGQAFVNCMVDKSILGLIGGMNGGIYAELVRKKEFYELAQKIMPRLIKAGVGGGIAGVVGGLAVSAILCTRA